MFPFLGNQISRTAGPGRVVTANPAGINTISRGSVVGATLQSDLISVAGAEASSLYSVRFLNTAPNRQGLFATPSYTTDSSTSATELRDGLIAAIDADGLAGSMVAVSAVSTDQILVIWLQGQKGTISFPANPTTDLTQASVTAALPFPIFYFGRAVQVVDSMSVQAISSEAVINPTLAGGPTIVFDLTTNNTAQSLSADILVNGVLYDFAATSSTTADLTLAAVATGLETAGFAASQITTDLTGDTVTVQLPPGSTGSVANQALGTVVATWAVTAPTAYAQFALVCDGEQPPCLCVDEGQGYASAAGGVLTANPSGGTVWAVPFSESSVITGGPVYVETTVGDNLGKLYTASSATRILWPEAKWVRVDPSNSTLAHIRL